MSSLHDLWNKTYEKGYEVRKSGKNGLNEWQPLKKEYMEILKDTKFPVKGEIKENVEKYLIIGDDKQDLQDCKFKYNDSTLDNKIDYHHFFIQHFRIPYLEGYDLSVLKFLQIAYNAGQLKASFENGDYDNMPNIKKFYNDHKLDQPDTFVKKDSLNILIGGKKDYRHKYLKYKLKYMKLKNN